MAIHGSGEQHTDDKALTVFTWIDAQHKFLSDTYDQLLVSPDRKHISRCLYLAHKIQHACQKHPMGVDRKSVV